MSNSRAPAGYDSIPAPSVEQVQKGYGAGSALKEAPPAATGPAGMTDTATATGLPPSTSSPLAHSVERRDFEPENRSAKASAVDGDASRLARATSVKSTGSAAPSRGGTLKKKDSLSRKSSLKRSDSRKSARDDNEKSIVLGHSEKFVVGDEDNMRSVYFTPVPTSGTPTEILANRFQAWRKVLKDLIAYYREIQTSYEHRSKSIMKVSNVVGNTVAPGIFLPEGGGGIADATHILRDFHKRSISEANKAREIEEDVILSLSGLRNDLHQKIKEIRGLASDFKNAVEKEMDTTRKAVHTLQDTIESAETHPNGVAGKGDPFLVRMAVERQIEKQIEEENYLHRAYLNLEGSGRELESIVVGEIQKSYNALAGILRRDADDAYDTIDRLRNGPLAMPRDHEWSIFVEKDSRFVDPRLPLRSVQSLEYPGKYHPAAAEVRSGMLERKSKYLKSYTAGWYVLSPTHLHEFKSPDRVHLQTPGMSLFLHEQKLGSHSQPGSSSHKFILKGRQTGAMHRGHSWVFRAESHDTMLAWYEAIKNLTEKTGKERDAFVRRHARSISSASQTAASVDSDGALDEDDEADEVPYSADPSSLGGTTQQDTVPLQRPQPGGRFPSDLQLGRGLREGRSSSSASSDRDRGVVAAASGPDLTTTEPAPAPVAGGEARRERAVVNPLAAHPTRSDAPERVVSRGQAAPVEKPTEPPTPRESDARLEQPRGLNAMVEQPRESNTTVEQARAVEPAAGAAVVFVDPRQSEHVSRFKENFSSRASSQAASPNPQEQVAQMPVATQVPTTASEKFLEPERDSVQEQVAPPSAPIQAPGTATGIVAPEPQQDTVREQLAQPSAPVQAPATAIGIIAAEPQREPVRPQEGMRPHENIQDATPVPATETDNAGDRTPPFHDASPDVTPLSGPQLEAIVASALSSSGRPADTMNSSRGEQASNVPRLGNQGSQAPIPVRPVLDDENESTYPATTARDHVTAQDHENATAHDHATPSMSGALPSSSAAAAAEAAEAAGEGGKSETTSPTAADYQSLVKAPYRTESETTIPIVVGRQQQQQQRTDGGGGNSVPVPVEPGNDDEDAEIVTQTVVTREVHTRRIVSLENPESLS